MRISVCQSELGALRPALLVIPVAEEDETFALTSTDPGLNARLLPHRQSGDFKASAGDLLLLHAEQAERADVLLVGLGKRGVLRNGRCFAAGYAVGKRLGGRARASAHLLIPPDSEQNPDELSCLIEGMIAASRGPGLYQREQARFSVEEVHLVALPSTSWTLASLNERIRRSEIVGEAVCWARELVNRAPCDKTPDRLAAEIQETLEAAGVKVDCWDASRIEAERFGGLAGVAAGSDHPPRFLVLEWQGAEGKPLALIGKGVTFDSGGLSLKPTASMEDMKSDMSGAAAVAAAFQAIARLNLPVAVKGYLPLTENMVNGRSMKLGDVLTMRNGLTVEVLNTDAEGRLILADALSYAVEHEPEALIDVATLTGACMVALGPRTAGLFANDDALAQRIVELSARTGERVWRMPLDPDAADGLKSSFADCKNVGSKWGGAITAAKFLEKFVNERPWAHLDIAGPSWNASESATTDVGGTGCFTRTLFRLVESRAAGAASMGRTDSDHGVA